METDLIDNQFADPNSEKYKKYKRIFRKLLHKRSITLLQLYLLVYEFNTCTVGYIVGWMQDHSKFFASESTESIRQFVEITLAGVIG